MSISCTTSVAALRQRIGDTPPLGSIPGISRLLAVSLFALLAALPARAQSAEKVIGIREHTPPQVLDGSAIRIGH